MKSLQQFHLNLKSDDLFIGQVCFYIGITFLVSALPISSFFLIISLIISFKKHKYTFLKDKWNYPLFFVSGLMIFSCLYNTLTSYQQEIIPNIKTLIWVDLFNWIPLFLSFWGFQIYLKTKSQRMIFSKLLLIGGIPFILSCISQYLLKFYGPFKTFWGLVVWYQKPLIGLSGVTGLFSNPNYAGYWLTILLPFIIAFAQKEKSYLNKLLISLYLILDIYFLLATNSRNAFFGLLLSFFTLFKIKFILTFIIAILLIFLFLIFIYPQVLSFFDLLLYTNNYGIDTTNTLINKLSEFKPSNIFKTQRFQIWQKSYELISKKPFFGWGAVTFAFFYNNQDGLWNIQHPHNIIIHLAYSYGLIVSIILLAFISILFIKAYRNVFLENQKSNFDYMEKAFVVSCLISITYHISDIIIYDGKINLIIWIFLACLKCINDEHEFTKNSIFKVKK